MHEISKKKEISFIIPVLDGEKYVNDCLTAISHQMESQDELIIVDNGSTDNTLELVKKFDVEQIIVSDATTISALRNLGAAQAVGDILAFIDIDCIIGNKWRQSAVKVLSENSIAATGSLYDLPEDASWIEKAWWSSKPSGIEKASYMVGGNFVIRKRVFQELNGFDPTLITDEDSDIGERINKRGFVIIDNPEVSAIHLGNPKTLVEFVKKEKWHSSSIIPTMQKHGIDKPMFMTFAFMGIGLISIFLLSYYGWQDFRGMLVVPLIFVVPLITATYRAIQYGQYRFFLPLTVLYLLFYSVRSITILQAPFKGLFLSGDK